MTTKWAIGLLYRSSLHFSSDVPMPTSRLKSDIRQNEQLEGPNPVNRRLRNHWRDLMLPQSWGDRTAIELFAAVSTNRKCFIF
jgi:hypothetical protein